MPSLSKIASVLAIVAAYAHVASTAPTPSPQFTEAGDAYSGEGGTANGGSVINTSDSSNKSLLGGLKLVDAFSRMFFYLYHDLHRLTQVFLHR
jgi:hypothetical protein